MMTEVKSKNHSNQMPEKHPKKPKDVDPSKRLDQLIDRLEKAKEVLQKVRSSIEKQEEEE
jgi:hypothetical protein